jgi:hypothetical protein
MSRPRLFFASGSIQFTDSCANSSGFHKQPTSYVGSEVLSAMVMKSTIMWEITSCSPLKVNRRFGRTHHLHFQGRISLLSRWYFTRLIEPWKWGYIFLRNVGWLSKDYTAFYSRIFNTPAFRDHGTTKPAHGSRSRSVSSFTQHTRLTETRGSSKTVIWRHHEPLSSASGSHNLLL